MQPPPRIIYPVRRQDRDIEVTGEVFHYLINVLRLRKGSKVVVLDGRGGVYEAIMSSRGKDSAKLSILGPSKEPERESPLKIVLLQAILKSQKMDLVLQKGTELGVYEFWPIVTGHSEVRWTRKLPHWMGVVKEATRQSRRAIVPEVRQPMDFIKAIEMLDQQEGLKIILSEKAKEAGLPETHPSKVFLLIGPEGGFSDEEERMAEDKGFITIGLGPRVLRAETAAIVATAFIQFLYGDMGLSSSYSIRLPS